MSETIRYTRIGKEDINFGTGTFEVRLADGRVVTLQQVDLSTLLSDASLSSRVVTLTTLTVDTLTASSITVGGGAVTGTLQAPEKADPASPVTGEIWINSGGLVLEYADDAATPTRHALVGDDTTQTLTNKTLTSSTISGPTLSGTVAGTYTLGGTPTLGSALNVNTQDFTNIDEAHFADSGGDATAAGRMKRNGANLTWHDSTQAHLVTFNDKIQTLQNKTLTTPTLTGPTLSGTMSGGTFSGTCTGTLSGTTVSGAAGATPTANVLYTDSVVKGWVVFQVDGTIDDDLNVSSITDTGAGNWTVNWATSFVNANYVVHVTPTNDSSAASLRMGTLDGDTLPSTTAARVLCVTTASLADPIGTSPRMFVMAIGDQ